MSYDIIIIIILTAGIQSIFGTGVLLFGTPLFLIMGYSFHFTLTILLPTSILISLLQLKNGFTYVDSNFYKKLIIYCIPFIFISLYYSNYSAKYFYLLKNSIFTFIFYPVLWGAFSLITNLTRS